MLNEKILRPILFAAVAAIHLILLLSVAFNTNTVKEPPPPSARVMMVTDFSEMLPAPPPPPPELIRTDIPQIESIAENMIETDIVPEQVVVAPGSINIDDFLPAHRVSRSPVFDEREILAALIYPPIAQRSGIEGRVILELFVDRSGLVQQVRILREEPEDRGFGEAAVRAFIGKRGIPAYANGEPVSARYRYPVSFTLK